MIYTFYHFCAAYSIEWDLPYCFLLSPSQDSNHPDDLFQLRYVTPGVKPFSYLVVNFFDNAAAVHQSYCPLLLNKARSLVGRGQRPQAWVATFSSISNNSNCLDWMSFASPYSTRKRQKNKRLQLCMRNTTRARSLHFTQFYYMLFPSEKCTVNLTETLPCNLYTILQTCSKLSIKSPPNDLLF